MMLGNFKFKYLTFFVILKILTVFKNLKNLKNVNIFFKKFKKFKENFVEFFIFSKNVCYIILTIPIIILENLLIAQWSTWKQARSNNKSPRSEKSGKKGNFLSLRNSLTYMHVFLLTLREVMNNFDASYFFRRRAYTHEGYIFAATIAGCCPTDVPCEWGMKLDFFSLNNSSYILWHDMIKW